MHAMRRILSSGAAFALSTLPVVALAATCPGSKGGLTNLTDFCTLDQFLTGILDAVITIAFPVIVLFLVYVGWLFVSAQGKPDKIDEAKKYFFWAIVGSLIVLGAKALSLAISATVQSLTP